MRIRALIRLLVPLLVAIAHGSASLAQLPEQGKPFPALTGRSAVSDATVDLEALRGKVVLVDFWATWCPPCRAAVPHLRDMRQRFGDKGLEIISISADRKLADLTDYLKKEKMDWYHIFDERGQLSRRFQIPGYPTTFVVGRGGLLEYMEVGFAPPGAELRRAIRKALDAEWDPEKLAEKALAEGDALRAAGKYEDALATYQSIPRQFGDTTSAQPARERIKSLEANELKTLETARARRAECWRLLKIARQLREAKRSEQSRKYFRRVIDEFAGLEEADIARREIAGLAE